VKSNLFPTDRTPLANKISQEQPLQRTRVFSNRFYTHSRGQVQFQKQEHHQRCTTVETDANKDSRASILNTTQTHSREAAVQWQGRAGWCMSAAAGNAFNATSAVECEAETCP